MVLRSHRLTGNHRTHWRAFLLAALLCALLGFASAAAAQTPPAPPTTTFQQVSDRLDGIKSGMSDGWKSGKNDDGSTTYYKPFSGEHAYRENKDGTITEMWTTRATDTQIRITYSPDGKIVKSLHRPQGGQQKELVTETTWNSDGTVKDFIYTPGDNGSSMITTVYKPDGSSQTTTIKSENGISTTTKSSTPPTKTATGTPTPPTKTAVTPPAQPVKPAPVTTTCPACSKIASQIQEINDKIASWERQDKTLHQSNLKDPKIQAALTDIANKIEVLKAERRRLEAKKSECEKSCVPTQPAAAPAQPSSPPSGPSSSDQAGPPPATGPAMGSNAPPGSGNGPPPDQGSPPPTGMGSGSGFPGGFGFSFGGGGFGGGRDERGGSREESGGDRGGFGVRRP